MSSGNYNVFLPMFDGSSALGVYSEESGCAGGRAGSEQGGTAIPGYCDEVKRRRDRRAAEEN